MRCAQEQTEEAVQVGMADELSKRRSAMYTFVADWKLRTYTASESGVFRALVVSDARS